MVKRNLVAVPLSSCSREGMQTKFWTLQSKQAAFLLNCLNVRVRKPTLLRWPTFGEDYFLHAVKICSYISILFPFETYGNQANIYLFKINRNTRKRCEVCSKLTIKAPERRQWRRSDVFTVNSEQFCNFS